jgi:hypothetical protein
LASDASGIGQQDYGWVSGRATAVAIDRADPSGNTVYLGGAYGGLWKSSNAGALNPSEVKWIPLIDDQPTLAVGAIAIQPNNPDPANSIVLVGTGEADSSADSYYGLGILRSADGGKTWSLIRQSSDGHLFAGVAFSKIAFSTANPGQVVAATAGASLGLIEGGADAAGANLGLYYSHDAGATWDYATINDAAGTVNGGSATSVVFDSGVFIAAVRFHGFYVSGDGVSWTRLANQPGPLLNSPACPANPASSTCPLYRGELAVVDGRNEVYAWHVDANENDEGIWRSTDRGNSWQPISTTSLEACGDSSGCGTENGSYNLALAAIADGTATDLYAGAVNIFKCRISSQSPACSGPDTFVNLTHVFGCGPNFGASAHVHPAQHALDSLVVNGTSPLYVANDGGIYRTLDGYSGLTSGSCSASNAFDSLNQTLGSMTQFVSFDQDSTNANTLLGGAQGNGSPATAEGLVSGGWQNVNTGDGGYSAINPASPWEWFTSTPGINIQLCSLGIACRAPDFAANPVVTGATLDGDQGAFYTPFILDPRNSGAMVVGTCRVWRGSSDGTGFVPLSNNFDTLSFSGCTGQEQNMVRALAAGGPSDQSGLSSVMYAGTDGFGPLLATIPAAGRLWVSTSASGGPGTWFDRTGPINPKHYPISAIALDPSDANGMTAYVGIMGFHTPHVWMTQSGGQSWVDFSGSLPDVPVNALVVDPGPDSSTPGTAYVGTDAGVFVRGVGDPDWSVVGPASGEPGFLPDVPVTALRIFKAGPTKLLRASTYGRGMWQFPLSTNPDFQIAVANPIQSVFVSQEASFQGSLSAFNDYSSAVNLSCAAGATALPADCAVTPTSVAPSAGGAGFTITAGGSAGDYQFTLLAAGRDPNGVTHTSNLTLHVMDVELSPPDPATVNVMPGGTTVSIAFQVSAEGAFHGNVDLSCSGLPNGAACNFSPADSAAPVAGSPVAVTLAISTSATTPAGIFDVTVRGKAEGAPERAQPLTLKVGSQDYGIAISNTSQNAAVDAAAVFNGTLTTASGYSSSVALSCGAGAPPACSVAPATAVPSATGTPFAVTVSSPVAQTYSFSVVAEGRDPLAISHSVPLSFQSTFDFSMTVDPNSRTVSAGQAASYDLHLSPQGGRFLTDVTLSCSGLPAKTGCAFSPAQVTPGTGDTTVSLSISTAAAGGAALVRGQEYFYAGLLPLFLVVLRLKRRKAAVLLALAWLALLPGCGGGLEGNSSGGGGSPQPGTHPGTYVITVTAAGALTHTAQVTLTVQ